MLILRHNSRGIAAVAAAAANAASGCHVYSHNSHSHANDATMRSTMRRRRLASMKSMYVYYMRTHRKSINALRTAIQRRKREVQICVCVSVCPSGWVGWKMSVLGGWLVGDLWVVRLLLLDARRR